MFNCDERVLALSAIRSSSDAGAREGGFGVTAFVRGVIYGISRITKVAA